MERGGKEGGWEEGRTDRRRGRGAEEGSKATSLNAQTHAPIYAARRPAVSEPVQICLFDTSDAADDTCVVKISGVAVSRV